MKKRDFKKQQSGFTLIEIIVVVVILSVLAAVIAPKFLGRVGQAQQTAAKADIQNISKALALYKLDNYRYPTTSEGLGALVTNPGSAKNWNQYLDKKPKDPWGNDYQYLSPGQKNNDFDVWSNGADGSSGGADDNADIGNWNLDAN